MKVFVCVIALVASVSAGFLGGGGGGGGGAYAGGFGYGPGVGPHGPGPIFRTGGPHIHEIHEHHAPPIIHQLPIPHPVAPAVKIHEEPHIHHHVHPVQVVKVHDEGIALGGHIGAPISGPIGGPLVSSFGGHLGHFGGPIGPIGGSIGHFGGPIGGHIGHFGGSIGGHIGSIGAPLSGAIAAPIGGHFAVSPVAAIPAGPVVAGYGLGLAQGGLLEGGHGFVDGGLIGGYSLDAGIGAYPGHLKLLKVHGGHGWA